MPKVIPAQLVSRCSDCPFRIYGGVVEDTCSQTNTWLGSVNFDEDIQNFPDFCPLENE